MKISAMFHKWEKPEIVHWMMYDCVMYAAIVCGFFTIGLERDATDKDFS